MTITGTTGDDNKKGTPGNDIFDMTLGGHDTVKGLAGDDTFNFGAEFDIGDHVYGGKGFDTLSLEGNYNLFLSSDTMTGIDELVCNGAFNYQFQLGDENVAAHQTLIVVGSTIASGHNLVFYGDLETDGRFMVAGSSGQDALYTGAGNDVINGLDGDDFIAPGGGEDTVNAGAGADDILFDSAGATLDAGDRIDGGDTTNINIIELGGDYSAGLIFNAHTMVNIETIIVYAGHSYSLNVSKASLPANFVFTVDAHQLNPGETAHIDGSAAKHYDGFNFLGGFGDDVLLGGLKDDSFTGSRGADTMSGGAGVNSFVYHDVRDSTGSVYGYDTIAKFNADADFFQIDLTPSVQEVNAVDAEVQGGKLSTGSFDANLEHAVGAGRLAAHDAALFHPGRGTLAGDLFLIVDVNGVAGYQAGADLVMLLQDPTHVAHFTIANFTLHG